jgi:deoxyribodipyrimidine photolyase-like uncharacterized protein
MTVLVPILGDQLSFDLSSLAMVSQQDAIVLMMEVSDETTYVRHHKQKLVYIISAMRHHAQALRRRAGGSITCASTIRTTPAVSPAKLPALSSGTALTRFL